MTFAVSPERSDAFARRKRGTNPAALLFALLITAGLIGMLLLVRGGTLRVQPSAERLVVVALTERDDRPAPVPKEKPVNEPEVFADSTEEPSPSSRPRTARAAPELVVVPPAAIDLAFRELPQVPTTADGLEVVVGAKSKGDLARGPTGRGGAGGDGAGGSGSGGAGSGKGDGRRLIASWAPEMDFSLNHLYYPSAARRAGVEGLALLDCLVLPRDRVRDCKVVGEKPAGYGFGRAALQTEARLRVRVHDQSGRRHYNKRVVIESFFVRPDAKAGRDVAQSDGKSQEPAP